PRLAGPELGRAQPLARPDPPAGLPRGDLRLLRPGQALPRQRPDLLRRPLPGRPALVGGRGGRAHRARGERAPPGGRPRLRAAQAGRVLMATTVDVVLDLRRLDNLILALGGRAQRLVRQLGEEAVTRTKQKAPVKTG